MLRDRWLAALPVGDVVVEGRRVTVGFDRGPLVTGAVR
jgi:hypothetical protein